MTDTNMTDGRTAQGCTADEHRAARRTVLAAGAAGLGLLATACGTNDGDSGTDKEATAAVPGPDSRGAEDTTGTPLAKTADIPVGGGKVFADQKVVVTQPRKGEFKAYSAVCTHQGCAVRDVRSNVINCPCHGSTFSAEDGSVTEGPATKPLPEQKIEVKGGSIHLA